MSGWLDYQFTVGMPHMVPNRLSEVELLKGLGAFQWDSIAQGLGRRSGEIVNGQRERLYASFVNVELAFPPHRSLDSFEEGARIGLRNRVSAYARRFVEGMFVFDSAPIPAEETARIATRQDLSRCGHPWAYMTNAFVARAGSNSRLRVFEPEGMDTAGFPGLEALPSGMAEHQIVQRRGIAGLTDVAPEGTAVRATGLPLEYRILPESDLNGAGLLYFARYVAIANYGVRLFLAEQLARPVSSALISCLSTERLNIYYFLNADAFDSVKIFVTAWLDRPPPTAPELDANGCRSASRFQFHLDLYRVSDGALMASCLLHKSLNVPDREKGLVYESERWLAHLRDEARQGQPKPSPQGER